MTALACTVVLNAVWLPMLRAAGTAPEISVSPSSFSESLFTGGSVTRKLRLTNSGGSDLSFDLAVTAPGMASPPALDVSSRLSPVRGGADTAAAPLNGSYVGANLGFGITDFGEVMPFQYPVGNEDLAVGSWFSGYTVAYIAEGSDRLAFALNHERYNVTPVSFTDIRNTPSVAEIEVVTQTSDGVLKITQRFVFLKAAKFFTITTEVASLSETPVTNVVFKRSADWDVDGTYQNDSWDYDFPRNMVVAWDQTYVAIAGVETPQFMDISGWDDIEDRATSVDYPTGPVINFDGMEILHYELGTLDPHQSTTIHAVYGAGSSLSELQQAIDTGRSLALWLNLDPTTGTVPAGGYLDVDVTFDATGLNGGEYDAQIVVASNDPDEAELTVPVHLSVTGVADIEVTPGALDYGSVYVGGSSTQTISVTNAGTDTLTVTSVAADHADFSADVSSFTLAVGESRDVSVTYRPSNPGPISAVLTIESDDPDEPQAVVSLAGQGLVAPDVSITPDSFDESLFTGQTSTRTMTIHNSGGSDLVFNVSIEGAPATVRNRGRNQATPPTAGAAHPEDRVREPAPEETPSAPILGAGPAPSSPNQDDFRFQENFEDGDFSGWQVAPQSALREVTTATAAHGTLRSYHERNFTNDHLDGIYRLFPAEQPGYMSFYVRSGSVANAGYFAVFDASGYELIFFFARSSGRFYVNADVGGDESFEYSPLTWYHVEFRNIDYASKRFDYYVDGSLVKQGVPFRFPSIVEAVSRVDLYNFDSGSEAWWDEIVLADQASPPWLQAAPTSATVPAGESAEIAITFDAAGRNGGDYDAQIVVTSNDPDEPVVAVPAHLHVTGAPDIVVSGEEVTLESVADYQSSGALTTHVLPVTVPPGGDGSIELIADGDYGNSGETASVTAEGTVLGFVGPTGFDCTPAQGSFALSAAQLAALMADGTVAVEVQNSSFVDAFCSVNRHTVRLHYAGPVDTIDFGPVFIGATRSLAFTVTNGGTDVLNVTSVATDHGDFSVDVSSFTLAVGESRNVTVTYRPSNPGPVSAGLRIQSDDPDESQVVVSLAGQGLIPPDVSVTPASFDESLFTGGNVTRTLRLTNSGGSDLIFESNFGRTILAVRGSARLKSKQSPIPAPASGRYDFERTPARARILPGNMPRTATGGGSLPVLIVHSGGDVSEISALLEAFPDIAVVDEFDAQYQTPSLAQLTAYRAVIVTGQVPFSDPAGVGNVLADYVDGGGGVVLTTPSFVPPWSIGGRFESDGYMPLVDGYGPLGASTLGPFDSHHPIMLGVTSAWGDLLAGGTVAHGAELVASWSNGLPFVVAKGPQVATINVFTGLPGYWTGDIPLILHNAAFWSASLRWLSVAPDSGVVPAGGYLDIDVTFDATGLYGGEYDAQIVVASNDPDEPEVTVPVHLHVTGVADIEVTPGALDYGSVYVGGASTQTISVTNAGTDALTVRGVAADHGDFSVDVSSFTLAVGESRDVSVTYRPSNPGPVSAGLTIESDDPDEPQIVVSLAGQGLIPPDVSVTPPSFDESLLTGQTRTRTLTVHNSGSSDLVFNISIEGPPATVQLRPTGSPSFPTAAASHPGDRVRELGPEETPGAPIPGAGPAPSSPNQDDFRFQENFEDGDFNGWQVAPQTAVREVTTATAANGTAHSYHEENFTIGHLQGIYRLFPAEQPSYMSFYVRSASATTSAGYFAVFDASGRELIFFFASSSGRFYVNADVGGDESFVYAPLTWYHVEFRNIDYASKRFDYYVNGSLVKQGVPFRFPSIVQAVSRVDLYNFDSGSEAWWDEIVLADNASPSWLQAAPAAATVPAGESVEIAITFDAAGLNGGDYDAQIVVTSNDPDEPVVSVPAHLHVTGAPDIMLSGEEVTLESTADYQSSGDSTTHVLPVTVPPGGDGSIELIADGDYGDSGETASVTAEGTLLGSAGPTGVDCTVAHGTFALSAAQLAALTADGTVAVEVQNSPYVDAFCAVNRHTVRLHYSGPVDTIDFGPLFIGATRSLAFTVTNGGTDVLNVTSVAADHGDFSVDVSSFTLAVGESRNVTVTYHPSNPGPVSAGLRIQSDDPDEPLVSTTLSGQGLTPPIAVVSPTSLSEHLPAGGSVTRTLRVTNTGASDLIFQAAVHTATASRSSTLPVAARSDVTAEGAFVEPVVESRMSGADVLLVQSGAPWGTASNEQVLNGNGIAFDTIAAESLPGTDLTPYRLLIVASDQSVSFYSALAAELSRIEAWVMSGGIFEFHAASNADTSMLTLPRGMRMSQHLASTNHVLDPTHPLVDGIPSEFFGTYASHSSFTNIPADAALVASDDVGQPNLVEYRDGLGSVIAGGQTFEWGLARGEAAGQILMNMIPYGHGHRLPWLDVDTSEGVVPPGGHQDILVTFDAAGLTGGEYDAQIVVTSNDPVHASIPVPVHLHVQCTGTPSECAPVAVCTDVTAVADGGCLGHVTAEQIGAGSHDPNGRPLTLSLDPAGPFALGMTAVTLTVTNDDGVSSTCGSTVRVVDVTPPEFSVRLDPNTLWQPDHSMVDVTALVSVSDNCGGTSILLTSVVSSEADNGADDGNTINDIAGVQSGTADLHFALRAERSGSGPGRIYTAFYEARDGAGNVRAASAHTVVPHDHGRADALDIRLDQTQAGTLVSWTPAPGAVSYDVVRGRVAAIRETDVVVDLGPVMCIAQNAQGASTPGRDTGTPAPGELFFYLVEYDNGTSTSYGEATRKPRAPGPGSCDP
jgi:hypothetical protein